MTDTELIFYKKRLSEDHRNLLGILYDAKQLVFTEEELDELFLKECGRDDVYKAWNCLEELIFLGMIGSKTAPYRNSRGSIVDTNVFRLTEGGVLCGVDA